MTVDRLQPGIRPRATVNAAVAAERPAELQTMPAEALGVDVDSLITLHTTEDARVRRNRLVRHVWKGAGFPTHRPTVEIDVDCPALESLPATRFDRLIQPLPHGGTATSYLVQPEHRRKGRIGLYLSGHGDPRNPRYHRPQLATMRELLLRGYQVGTVDMPFFGWNREPTSTGAPVPPPGWPEHHESLAEHESEQFSAARLFVEPAVTMINEVGAAEPITDVAVVGFSGGSWTATLLAAIDQRITRSFQVAGSCPFYLRPFPRTKPNYGDWEQRRESQPDLYAIAGYLDLYLLGADGPGRRQLQIINRFDPVCFPGVGHRSYSQPLADRAARLGGSWEAVDDPTHGEHQVSEYAISVIAWELDHIHRPSV